MLGEYEKVEISHALFFVLRNRVDEPLSTRMLCVFESRHTEQQAQAQEQQSVLDFKRRVRAATRSRSRVRWTTRFLVKNRKLCSIETLCSDGLCGCRSSRCTRRRRLKSLFAIKVMRALSEKKAFVPYQDSVLTKLLRDSLGSNSMTMIVCTASPYRLRPGRQVPLERR